MSKNSQQTIFGLVGLISKSLSVMFAGLCVGFMLSACSSSGTSSKSSSGQQNNKSADFQRRLQAEQAAEDARDRNAQIQEQTRMEEVEVQRMRTERAAQRNAQRASQAQQNQDNP
jgi:hypothetical protein